MMPLRAGSVFAKAYEIVKPLSAGGMGIVYEVIHLGTKRHRALKIMLANIVSDPTMRARFSLEAIVAADVESEHLTEIFDAGIDPETDCPYLVMELLRGEDLGAKLKRGERLPGEMVLTLISQVARALEKTHERGIVHRDLKPDNLFVTQRDDGTSRMKILDFGIAKVVDKNPSGPQATTKSFGTPYYMAREQITGESNLIGPESDLYAVGQIVFTLLTGAPYFQDEAKDSDSNVLAVLMAVGTGTTELATIRARRRGVVLPKSFDAWFAQATALLPQNRFHSATELITGLRDVLMEPILILDSGVAPLAEVGNTWASPEEAFASKNRLDVSPLSHSRSDLDAAGLKASDAQSNPGGLHQTGDVQSLTTTQVPRLKKSSRAPLFGAAVAILAAVMGVVIWRVSLSRSNSATGGPSDGRPAAANAGADPAATARTASTDSGIAPVIAPGSAAGASPTAVASAAPSASIAATPSAAASNVRTAPPPHPAGVLPPPGNVAKPPTGGSDGTPVWETR